MVILEIKDDGTLIYNGKIYAEVEKSSQYTASGSKESIFAEMVKDLERKEDREKYQLGILAGQERQIHV